MFKMLNVTLKYNFMGAECFQRSCKVILTTCESS